MGIQCLTDLFMVALDDGRKCLDGLVEGSPIFPQDNAAKIVNLEGVKESLKNLAY